MDANGGGPLASRFGEVIAVLARGVEVDDVHQDAVRASALTRAAATRPAASQSKQTVTARPVAELHVS